MAPKKLSAKHKAARQKMRAHLNRDTLTLSVPEAGRRYFGMSRQGSYMAAERGDIPTIRVGKLLRCPIRALDKMLDEAGKK
jgi:hypothetical protein